MSFRGSRRIDNNNGLNLLSDQISAVVDTEVSRATTAESTLTSGLAAEVSRATAAEAALSTSISNEVTARQTAVSQNATNLTNLSNALNSTVTAYANSFNTDRLNNNSGNTLNIADVASCANLNLATGSNIQTVNIGTGTGATTINIGGAGDTINFAGTRTTINVTDLDVQDKLITLNKGGPANTAFSTGLSFEEAGAEAGYLRTSADGSIIEAKAPRSATVIGLNQSLKTTDSVTFANVTGSLTGNASTATTCTTIPTLSGEVTNAGNAVTLSTSAVTGKLLTGLDTSNTTSIAASDSVLQAIGKAGNQLNNATSLSTASTLVKRDASSNITVNDVGFASMTAISSMVRYEFVTMPTSTGTNNTTLIAALATPNGALSVQLQTYINAAGFPTASVYEFGLSSNITGGAWQRLVPISTSNSVSGSQQFEIDVAVNGTTINFRVRRTLGTLPATLTAFFRFVGLTSAITYSSPRTASTDSSSIPDFNDQRVALTRGWRPPNGSGSYMDYSRSGTGVTAFSNQRGGSAGGFEWLSYDNTNTLLASLMTLDSSGNLAVNGTVSGSNITASSTSATANTLLLRDSNADSAIRDLTVRRLKTGGLTVLDCATGTSNTYLQGGGNTNSGVQNSICIGSNAGAAQTTATSNIFLGAAAGQAATTAGSNVGIGGSSLGTVTGASNVGVGVNAMALATSGSNNAGLGQNAGFGSGSANYLTTGSNNTFLGATTGVSNGAYTNSTAVGYGAICSGSNNIQLGNGSITDVRTSGLMHCVGLDAGSSAISNVTTMNASGTVTAGNFSTSGVVSAVGASLSGNLVVNNVTGVQLLNNTPHSAGMTVGFGWSTGAINLAAIVQRTTDMGGYIEFQTGAGTAANSIILVITWNNAFPKAPSVVFSAGNSETAGAIGTLYGVASTTNWALIAGVAALYPNTTYKIHYTVMCPNF